MTLKTPPSWLQNGLHPAVNDRLIAQALIASSGIIGASSLAVAQSVTPGMSVVVASGWGAIVGDYTTNMGVYNFYNDASATLPITTANPSNPRIDRIVVTINDSYYIGAIDNVTFSVIAGTPAASPIAPAAPANSISLATIAVGAAVTSILTANITDTRVNVTSNLPFVPLSAAYSAPIIGSTSIASGATVPTLAGLTKVQSTQHTQLDGNGYEMDLVLLNLAGAI